MGTDLTLQGGVGMQLIALLKPGFDGINFGEGSVPDVQASTTVVRIAVGIDMPDGLSNAGGDFPKIELANELHEPLSHYEFPDTITDGSYKDVAIHNSDGQQTPYALFAGQDDPVCIAYIATTWSDGTNYGWIGDWGWMCGGPWYYSNIYWNGGDYSPVCTWIGAEGTAQKTGFEVYFPAFIAPSGGIPSDFSPESICGDETKFKWYNTTDPVMPGTTDDISYGDVENPGSTASTGTTAADDGTPQKKRAATDTHLVISRDARNHAATQLCESASSLGPDMANTGEGKYCRMSDKSLWPICESEDEDNCFDLDSQQLVVNGISARDTGYSKVLDWRK